MDEEPIDLDSSNPYEAPEVSDTDVVYETRKRSWPWIVMCLAIAAASVLYRILVLGQREQSALMFIGLPLVLAVLLTLTPRPKSATGMIMKGVSLALLLFGVLLIEGFICIIMAAPLFFLVGYIVGWLVDRNRVRDERPWYDDRLRCSILGVIAMMSFEGVTEWLSFERGETVTVVEVVNYSPEQVRQMLSKGPSFDQDELPMFLKLGFPQPASIEGADLAVGTEWVIHMAGGEGKPGDLTVKVVKNDAESIRFECVSDKSHIAHWMDWKSVEWKVEDLGGDQSRIIMTMEYDRLLDPAWYFKPIERYGVRKAGEYFISQTFRTE